MLTRNNKIVDVEVLMRGEASSRKHAKVFVSGCYSYSTCSLLDCMHKQINTFRFSSRFNEHLVDSYSAFRSAEALEDTGIHHEAGLLLSYAATQRCLWGSIWDSVPLRLEVGSSVTLETYGAAKQHRSSFYEHGSTEARHLSDSRQGTCLPCQEIFDKLAPQRLDHEVHLRKMKKFLKDWVVDRKTKPACARDDFP